MAQSTVPEPSLRQPAEAPAQAPASFTTTHRCPITSPGVKPTDIFLPLNPVLEIPLPGPAVTPVINAQTTLHLDAPISHGNTLITAEDENDIWQAMVKTFKDLYQGLAAENIPTPIPAETSSISPIVNGQVHNLFAKPFHHGFRRVVDVDQQPTGQL